MVNFEFFIFVTDGAFHLFICQMHMMFNGSKLQKHRYNDFQLKNPVGQSRTDLFPSLTDKLTNAYFREMCMGQNSSGHKDKKWQYTPKTWTNSPVTNTEMNISKKLHYFGFFTLKYFNVFCLLLFSYIFSPSCKDWQAV